MISFFRRATRSPWTLGLFALVLIAFLVTGVNTKLNGVGAGGSAAAEGDVVASVGQRRFGTEDVAQRIQSEVEQMRARDPSIDLAGFVGAGGVERMIGQLVDFGAIEAFARSTGLTASKRMVDGEIASIPAFNGPDGKFSEPIYRQALAQRRLTDASVRQDIAGDLIRAQMVTPVAGASRAPAGVARPYAALFAEQRQGTVGFIPAAVMAGGPQPTAAEAQAFYRANLLRYSLGERRVIRYAAFGIDQVAAKPSEADIKAAYDADAKTYAARDVRHLAQVVFPTEAEARAFAAKAQGSAFNGAAGARRIDLGEKTKAEFADLSSPAAADAAFAAPVGSTAQPARSDFGWNVVHVDAARTIPGKSLASVRDTLVATLTKTRGVAALTKLAQAIQDELTAGASFDDVAKKHNLQAVTTPAVLADGRAPTDPGFTPSPDIPLLAKAAFQAEPNDEPAIQVLKADERFAMLAVGEVDPAAPRPFAQVSDTVLADIKASRAATRARALATAVLAKVNGGMGVAQALAGAGVQLPPTTPISAVRLEVLQKGAAAPGPLKLLFAVPKGKARLLPAPANGGWYIVKVDAVKQGEPSLINGLLARTRGDLGQTMAQEYVQQLAGAARDKVKPQINPQAIAALKARLTGAAPPAQ